MKLNLEGPGAWERTYRELRNEDIRSYTSGAKRKGAGRKGIWEDGQAPPAPDNNTDVIMTSDDKSDIELDAGVPLTRAQMLKARKKGTGETRKQMSWIWLTTATALEDLDSDSEQANDILRSEWARSRARSRRAHEEVELVAEEMRRVLKTLEWHAGQWDAKESHTLKMGVTDDIREWLVSYAKDQATVHRSLRASFQSLWKTPLTRVDRVVSNNVQLDEVNESAEIGEGEAPEGGDEGEASDSDSDAGDDDEDQEEVDTHGVATYPFNQSVHMALGGLDVNKDNDGDSDGDGDSCDGDNDEDDNPGRSNDTNDNYIDEGEDEDE